MAIRDALKVSRKTFFNPKSWVGWDEIKNQFFIIVSILKDLFTVATPNREETFEQAKIRFNLSEQDIVKLSARYLHFSLFFLACFLLTFAYAFFLLFTHHAFLAWLMALSVAFFFLGQAFRFHFWRFQLQKRHLGVTFNEWKNAILGTKE